MSKQALFAKWQIYSNLTKDIKKAKATLEEYSSAYPDDELVVFMKVAMGEINYENAPKLRKMSPASDDVGTLRTRGGGFVPMQKVKSNLTFRCNFSVPF